MRSDIVARGIPAHKVTVIPNAVDIEAFEPGGQPDQALKAQLGLQGASVIGFIGSFYAYEGLDLLLDAIAKLLRSRECAYDIFVPFSQYSLLSDMRALGRILSEEHQPEGSLVWVMLDKPSLGKLEAKYGGLIQPSKDMPV